MSLDKIFFTAIQETVKLLTDPTHVAQAVENVMQAASESASVEASEEQEKLEAGEAPKALN